MPPSWSYRAPLIHNRLAIELFRFSQQIYTNVHEPLKELESSRIAPREPVDFTPYQPAFENILSSMMVQLRPWVDEFVKAHPPEDPAEVERRYLEMQEIHER